LHLYNAKKVPLVSKSSALKNEDEKRKNYKEGKVKSAYLFAKNKTSTAKGMILFFIYNTGSKKISSNCDEKDNKIITKSGSASQLKLAQRLKEKRLNQHLEDPGLVKTFTSDVKSDSQSQISMSKNSIRMPGRRYRETRRSQERNKGKLTERTNYNPNNYDLVNQDLPITDNSEGNLLLDLIN
jgi:hypothetical protein